MFKCLLLLTLLIFMSESHGLEIAGVKLGGGRLIKHILSEIFKPLAESNEKEISSEGREVDSTFPMMSEEDLPTWRNLVETIMYETENLDDKMYVNDEDAKEEEEEEELENRLGLGMKNHVDCYGLPEPVSSILKFVFRKDSTVNAKFFLSTRKRPEQVQIENNLQETDFDPKRRTVFIIHGFMSHGATQWVRNMSDAMLSRVDANVFAVDWSEGGNSWMYWKAVANTRVAGEEACEFIRRLLKLGLKTSNIHLIGHSLGAHICSYIASHIGGVGRITGLDPAQPCFQENSGENRLDPSDAEFIDVIHTNGRVLEKLGLGLPQPIGHVDFYPNGGAKQPGCSTHSKALVFPLYNAIKNRIEKSICSHGRSYMFFIESMKMADTCSFWGHGWSRNDTEAQAALLAPCGAHNCSEMGIESDVFPARGSFYVPTKANAPYCIYDPRTDGEMVASLSKLYKRVGRLDRT